MARWTVIALLALLAAACADVPAITPVDGPSAGDIADACRRPYISGRWQFTHAIAARAEGGRIDRLLGVAVVDSGARTVDAVLMTVEGLSVLQARWDGALSVSRALPPFDRRSLAEGLMADMRLLFFPPIEPPSAVGTTSAGLPVCRYAQAEGTTLDVVSDDGRGWELHVYDPHGRQTRSVRARDLEGPPGGRAPLPEKVDLTATGPYAYHLSLELISAEKVSAPPAP
jgi:hypothetical protein